MRVSEATRLRVRPQLLTSVELLSVLSETPQCKATKTIANFLIIMYAGVRTYSTVVGPGPLHSSKTLIWCFSLRPGEPMAAVSAPSSGPTGASHT